MAKNPLASLSLAAFILLAIVAPGCGKRSPKTPADKAEALVDQFLDAWTRGERPEQFEGGHPNVSVLDPDWKAGMRLLSFLSVETKQSQQGDSQFRCRVSLTLQNNLGKTVDKQVVYEIVTGGKCVIRRTDPS